MFGDGELTLDGFLGGRLRILQPRQGYRAAMDPVLLAAAVPAAAGHSVLDLGCGAGVAALCLGARVPGIALAGLELQSAYADLARRNAAANAIGMTVLEGDLAHPPAALRALAFDAVMMNPPYYRKEGGTPAADPGRGRAMHEATPLAVWVDAGLRRLRPGGTLAAIQAAERLPDLLAAIGARAGGIAVLPVQPRAGRPAGRVILTARKGGRGRFRLLAPLVLHEGEAHEADRENLSPAAAAILRDGASLAAAFHG